MTRSYGKWPIQLTDKNEGDVVISFVGRLHDGLCRCRSCKPSLAERKAA